MIFELTSDFQATAPYDVCIIGAGAAGIVLARTLARAGRTVLLAEGGGLDYSDESQAIYRGRVVGDPYFELEDARLRYFGGSTNHWAGVCRPLDERDFQPKAYVSFTGWPIQPRELSPYLGEAREILGLDPFPADAPLPGTQDLQQMFWRYADRLRLGEQYLPEIQNSSHVSALLHANFIGFDLHDQKILAAWFSNYEGNRVKVEAFRFVLACGGIENSRILLIENAKINNVLGNSSNMIGKYFMEHPHFTIGEHFLYRDHPFELSDDEINLIPTPGFMERSEIMNCRITLDLVRSRPGWQGFVQTAMCSVAPEMSDQLLHSLGRRYLCGGTVRASWEQEPRAENQIALGDDVDVFGNPRVQMIWHKSELDRRTFTTLALRVGRYLAEVDAGRLRLEDWVLDEHADYPVHDRLGGKHHMGGTRMASSPRDGVVDRNCLVFGTNNLYVAGSSVFPNGGQSNPTLTIVLLSLRLADFLTTEAQGT
jgi:choline dehydrogenase-like flavoprotein